MIKADNGNLYISGTPIDVLAELADIIEALAEKDLEGTSIAIGVAMEKYEAEIKKMMKEKK